MKLELKISEEVQSVDEFLESIKRKNSRFEVLKHADGTATLHLRPRFFSMFTGPLNFIVWYVIGIVDSSVINTLAPSVYIKHSIAYRAIQLVLIVIFLAYSFYFKVEFDSSWILVRLALLAAVLLILHLFLQFAKSVYREEVEEEINYVT